MRSLQRVRRAARERVALATGAPAGAVDRLEECHQVSLHRDPAIAVSITEAQRRIGEDPQQRRAALEGDPRDRRPRGHPGAAADPKLDGWGAER